MIANDDDWGKYFTLYRVGVKYAKNSFYADNYVIVRYASCSHRFSRLLKKLSLVGNELGVK